MIIASFIPGYDEITSSKLHQWDYGQQLHIYGLKDLSDIIQVHFCDRTCDKTIVRTASKVDDHYEVSIPDRLLENEYSINAFIYINTKEYGQTIKTIHIPVIGRKQPEDYVDPGDPTVDDKLTMLMDQVSAFTSKLNGFTNIKDGTNWTVWVGTKAEYDEAYHGPKTYYIVTDDLTVPSADYAEKAALADVATVAKRATFALKADKLCGYDFKTYENVSLMSRASKDEYPTVTSVEITDVPLDAIITVHMYLRYKEYSESSSLIDITKIWPDFLEDTHKVTIELRITKDSTTGKYIATFEGQKYLHMEQLSYSYDTTGVSGMNGRIGKLETYIPLNIELTSGTGGSDNIKLTPTVNSRAHIIVLPSGYSTTDMTEIGGFNLAGYNLLIEKSYFTVKSIEEE